MQELPAAKELVNGIAVKRMLVGDLRTENAPFALRTADVELGLFATADELIRFHRWALNGKAPRR